MYLKNLAGEIPKDHVKTYLTREMALRDLKDITGQDFGYNIESWQAWINKDIDAFHAMYTSFINSR